MNKSVKWAAELSHVREVSLLGTADLAFWKDRLRNEVLLPAERDGQAQILIIAASMRFAGIRFQEVSFSVLVSGGEDGKQEDACYLIRAFNSRRFIAFCERTFFSTPYYHGDVHVAASLPASIRLVTNGEVVFSAEMGAENSVEKREPSRHGIDGWEGAVYLPASRRGMVGQGKLFFARLRGETKTFPFLTARDSVAIRNTTSCELFQALLDSHFVATEWAVREDATHAKSITYRRSLLASGGSEAAGKCETPAKP